MENVDHITGLTFVGLCAHTLEDDEGASISSTHRKRIPIPSLDCDLSPRDMNASNFLQALSALFIDQY